MNLQSTLDYELLVLSGNAVTVASVLTSVLILVFTLVGSRIVRGILGRALARSGVARGALGTVDRVFYYGFLTVGVAVALTTVGIDLSALFATGAVAAVGLAFAMQNILQNFVSGIILLAEQSIKPSDVLVVEGQKVRVERMGIRATIARSTDEEEIILPNSTLVQGTVKNLTLADGLTRIRTSVGVAYDSDLDRAMDVLQAAAESVEERVPDQEPIVVLTEFADSAVVFEVSIWSDDPWIVAGIRSRLNLAIWRALEAASITIAFPQLDVHVVPEDVGPREADPLFVEPAR